MGWPLGKGHGHFVGRVGFAQWAEKVKFNLMDDLCGVQLSCPHFLCKWDKN